MAVTFLTEFWTYSKLFFLYVGWWLIPLLVIVLYKKRLSKYPVDVVIYEKRGENLIKTNDVCGRFEDPVVCYKLKMSKDSIPIPNYDWVLQCANRPTNIIEKMSNLLCGRIGTITLFKYGSKQYKPIEVKIGNQLEKKFKEVKGKDGQPIWVTVYTPINVKQNMSQIDFDIIDWDDINHMTQELRAIALRRSPTQKFLEKYGWLVGLIIVALIFIIAIYYAYQMIMDAGDRYIAASQATAGYAQAPVDQQHATAPSGLGSIIPGA